MSTKSQITSSPSSGYVSIGGVPVYGPLVALLAQAGVDASRCFLHVVPSRWSRPNDRVNAAEQANKTFETHRLLVPGLARLCACVPDSAWVTPEGQSEYGIRTVQAWHITPHRDPKDPDGKAVIGYLLPFDDVLALVMSHSGFTAILKEDGDELNLTAQATIELCKFAVGSCHRAGRTSEKVALRLSDDRTRKGRLNVELARMDRWAERLDMRFFVGAAEYDFEGFGRFMAAFDNGNNERDRTEKVKSLTKGLLRGVDNGSLPAAEVNLPPYLGHLYDANLPGQDKRVRDGTHLQTVWLPGVVPALQEYLAAFARGARGVELDQILRRHKVPTPRQLPARDGKARYSSLRDTTWDQLSLEAGAVRAMRWMTYSGRPVRAVPIDATPEQRARIEHENALALRKLELLRSGQYLYHYANPTPTEDAYGKHVVVRSGPLDPGWIPATITFDWPAKRKLVFGPDGVLVTSDEIELDDDGQPIPWERLGVPLTVLDDCIARLASQAVEGPATDKEVGAGNRMVRALRIQRWTSNEDDGEVRQWEAFNHWTADAKEVCPDGLFYRWILWRPAPCPQVPAQHLNLGWGAVEADVRRPASPSSTRASERKTKPEAYADHPERHVGTLREYRIVAWLAEALRNDLLDVLDQDLVVSAALLGDRARDAEARHRRLLDQASTARDRADAAKLTANGYEEAAMLDLGSADRDGYSKKLAKAKAKAEEADRLNAEAERLEAAASEEPVVEAELPVRRLAQLIEILARAGTRELEGRVPAAIAVITHEMFTGWQFRPGPPRKLEVSCTARIPLADGTIIERRLCGLVDNTRKWQRGEDPYGAAVLHDLETGKGFDEIAATSTRPTSRSALYCQARERLKQLSPDASVATYMIHPLLDHPHPLALPAVIAALTGDASEQSLWTPGFERHMGSTYRTGTWGKSACPTAKMKMIHRVFAAVRQCPGGARIHDVAAAADVPVDFVKRLVTPLPTTEGSGGHRRWPKFLCWVSGRVGIEVRAHACPHDDCRAPAGRRWATDPVFLPETAPEPGDIGGVLCPACHRLPDKAYGDIYFPAAWHQPVARVTDGNRGSLRIQQLTRPIAVGRVGGVVAPPATLKLDELAVEFGLGRQLLADILLRHRVPYEAFATGGGGGEGTRLYAAKPARAAVSLAFTSVEAGGDGMDPLAYGPTALRSGAAAARAGVTPTLLAAAADAGAIPVHHVGNGARRYQIADLDAWVAGGRSVSPLRTIGPSEAA